MTLPDNDFERRLAEVLHAEAHTVTPAGDGLVRIRERIERRRARLRWLRPTLAVATAGALGATAFVGATLADGIGRVTGDGADPAAGPTASAPSSPASASASTQFVRTPLWPFTSGEEVAGWREGGGPRKQRWLLDPAQVATRFATFLGVPGLQVTSSLDEPAGKAVTLGRDLGGVRRTVTVVHLARVGTGAGAPWVVRVAGAYGAKIVGPKFETRITSPVHVAVEAEGTLTVEVWSARRTTPYGSATATDDGQNRVEVDVAFSGTTGGVGMLVARQTASDGGPAKLTAVPVLLPGGPPVVSAARYPASFVGVADGRIATFDSTTGRRLRWLTSRQPGGGDSEPVLAGDTVFYVHGTGTCSAEIRRVPVQGGTPTRVVGGLPGAAAQVAVSADAKMLAWVQSNCAGGGELKTLDLRTGKVRDFAIAGPPTVEGKPAWAPDDRHLALRYGHSAGGANGYPVVLLDTATATSLEDAKPIPSTGGCDQGRPAYTPRGSLLFVTCDGTRAAVVRLANRTLVPLFSVPGGDVRVTDVITSVDVSSTGVVVVEVADRDGAPRIMRWTGGPPVTIETTASSPTW